MSHVKLRNAGVAFLGLITLFHAGYSAFEVKSAENNLPFDITLQTLIGMSLSVIGGIMSTSPFVSIDIEEELKKTPLDSLRRNSSMKLANNRGRFMFA